MSTSAIRQPASEKSEKSSDRHSNGTSVSSRGTTASSGRFTLETSSSSTPKRGANPPSGIGRAPSPGGGGNGAVAATEKQENSNRNPNVSLTLVQPQTSGAGSNDNSFDSISLSSATPTSPPLSGSTFRFSPLSSAASSSGQLAAKASPGPGASGGGGGQATLSPGTGPVQGQASGQNQAQGGSPEGSPGAAPPPVPQHQSAQLPNFSLDNQLSVGPAFKRPSLADVGRARTGTASSSSHSRNFSHPRDLFRAFQAALRSGGKSTHLTRQTSAEASNHHVLDSFTSVPGSSPQSPRTSRLNSLSVGSPASTPIGSGAIPIILQSGGGSGQSSGGSSSVSRGGLKILVNGQQHRASPLVGDSGGNTGSNTPTTILKTPVGRTSSSGSGNSIPARGSGSKKNTVTFDTRCGLSMRRCSADAGAMLAATEEEHLGRTLAHQHRANSHTPLSGTASIDASMLLTGPRLLNPGGSEKPRRKQLEVPLLSLVRTPISAEIKRDLDAPYERLHTLLEPVNSVSLMDASDMIASIDDFDNHSSPSHRSAPKGASSSPAHGRRPSLASVQALPLRPSSPSSSVALTGSRPDQSSNANAAAGATGSQSPSQVGPSSNRPISPLRMDRLDSGASTDSASLTVTGGHLHSRGHSRRQRAKERMGSTSSEGRIDTSNTATVAAVNVTVNREARERVRLEGLEHKRVSSPHALSPLSPSARGGSSPLLQVNDASVLTFLKEMSLTLTEIKQ